MLHGFKCVRLSLVFLSISELVFKTPGRPSVQCNQLRSHLRLLKLKGGSHDTAMISETADLVANKSSFRQIIESHVTCRVRVDSSEMCAWDWREMCPWAKEYSDENNQFLLEPMPNSEIHILSLQPDQPAHLDGQWKMGRTRRGSFSGVHLSHFTDVPDARLLMLIYGGPWTFESCEVQCRMLNPAPFLPPPPFVPWTTRSCCACTANARASIRPPPADSI